MKKRWSLIASFIRDNLFALIALVFVAAILLISLSMLFKSPGIEFALQVKTVGATMRIGPRDAILQDIAGIAVAAERGADKSAAATNDILDPVSKTKPLESIEGSRVNTIVIPAASLLDLAFSRRDGELSLTVEGAETRNVEAMISKAVPLQNGKMNGIDSQMLKANSLTFRVTGPQWDFEGSPSFRVSGLHMELVGANALEAFPVSLVSRGELIFLAFGQPLDKQVIDTGQTLRFEGLSAEVSALSFDGDSISFRLLGRADDVETGFGSTFVSVYPSVYEGLGSLQIVQLILSSLSALVLAAAGGASLFKDEEEPRQKGKR